MSALAAYARGASAAGVEVAVIDTGILTSDPDFTGPIDPASADTAGGRSIDNSGHGHAVAAIIAARRDGVGTHGVAFDATLVVFRTDFPGSCAAGDCIYSS